MLARVSVGESGRVPMPIPSVLIRSHGHRGRPDRCGIGIGFEELDARRDGSGFAQLTKA